MKVRDKTLRKDVEVLDKHCLQRPCYQPCEWKGTVIPGRGYQYAPKSSWKWTCLRRDNRGCPDPIPEIVQRPRGSK